jgi:ABC-2 type transport system permease protein
MRNVLVIARRDLRAYFDSLTAYIVLGGTMILLGILMFLIPHQPGVFDGTYWEVDRATIAPMFCYLPPLMSLFVVPLVTMRSLAGEKGSGTLELLITMPVRDSEVILGKYLAALTMVLMLLAATLLYPILMYVKPWHLGALDWGPVWSGYLGLLLFSLAAVAIGMLFSSLTESDIVSFFATAATLVILYAIGLVVSIWPGIIADIVGFFSFHTRVSPFTRGLIDTRAIVYFLSVTVLCLLVAFRSLESRKWS